jgi:integrase/recombinase XerD
MRSSFSPSGHGFVVQIVRKADLPLPSEVPDQLREAAATALSITLREPRSAGFPLLFSADMSLIEPAVAFLHEHGVQRAHTDDTVRTYAEILYDWFETLEQNRIDWADVDGADLVAYRNRMLREVSPHTGRPYSVRTINHRVRGVLLFYEWVVRTGWLRTSPLIGRANDFTVAGNSRVARVFGPKDTDRSLFVLRQFESLPRPFSAAHACELLASLPPPYALMARWQLYTGLRVSELLRLTVKDVAKHGGATRSPQPSHQLIDVMRKGRKSGYVIASSSLLQDTFRYMRIHRSAWLKRAARRGRVADRPELFINSRGSAIKKNTYQCVISRAGAACGFKATTHVLRATFACMTLARLEQLATQGAAINPLLIVKVLMGHEHLDTTDRYLRAIAVDTCVLTEVLSSLLGEAH